jgi:hypothetical protein
MSQENSLYIYLKQTKHVLKQNQETGRLNKFLSWGLLPVGGEGCRERV